MSPTDFTTDTITGVGDHEFFDPQIHTNGTADQRTHDMNDKQTVDNSSVELTAFPSIAQQNYLTDDEFGDMYKFCTLVN